MGDLTIDPRWSDFETRTQDLAAQHDALLTEALSFPLGLALPPAFITDLDLIEEAEREIEGFYDVALEANWATEHSTPEVLAAVERLRHEMSSNG